MATKCPICLQDFEDGLEQCPSCGFKFSGATTSFAPVKANTDSSEDKKDTLSLNEKDKVSNRQEPHESSLRVIKGPQGEIKLPLSKDRMTIGRSPDSDIFLNDRTVSREHAIISKNEDVYQISDSNSFNGLWVNNKNVLVSDLHNGDIIQIGIFFLRFDE